ncbi:MAG: YdcF family protein, partial [Acidimicrobiales bacterium]
LVRLIFRMLLWLLAAIVVYLVVTAVQVYLTGRHFQPHAAGAIVVMGAAQYNGVPSPDLEARLNEAKFLWQQQYATNIMVTGSKEPGDTFTEAQASARYLVANGIPGQDIFQAGGRDSWENLADASPVLLAHGDKTILLVTDGFHEARCLAIATSVGLSASATPTQTSPIRGWSTVPYYAKETLGVGLGRIIGFNRLTSLHSSLG